jgi:hypothetical protein
VTSSGITAREPQQNPVLVFSITLKQKRVCPTVWIILVLHDELASVRALLVDWSLANSGEKKKEYIHTHSYTHVVVHISMYDGEEA